MSELQKKTIPVSPGNISLMGNLIGLGVILLGVVLQVIVLVTNYQDLFGLLTGQLLFSLWFILPNAVFFLVSKKLGNLYLLSALAVLFCLAQLYFFIVYFTSNSSTSALVLLFAPFYLLAGLGVCTALLWIVKKFFIKK